MYLSSIRTYHMYVRSTLYGVCMYVHTCTYVIILCFAEEVGEEIGDKRLSF